MVSATSLRFDLASFRELHTTLREGKAARLWSCIANVVKAGVSTPEQVSLSSCLARAQ